MVGIGIRGAHLAPGARDRERDGEDAIFELSWTRFESQRRRRVADFGSRFADAFDAAFDFADDEDA